MLAGLIYLKDNLVAICFFQNNLCHQYFILKELADKIMLETINESILPEILYKNDGLYGITQNVYEYFSKTKYFANNFPIKFNPLQIFVEEEIKKIFDKNEYKLLEQK